MKLGALAVCAALVACRTSASEPADAAYESGLAFTFADAEPTLALASASPAAPATPLAAFANAAPRGGKSIGHTSVVFRVDFEGGLRAAYKPESKRGKKRYRGEVAAYRLARALGIPNVPPAGIRTFKRDAFRSALSSDAAALAMFDDEVVDEKGRVYGALMPWIDKLAFIPLESPTERVRWKKELENGGDLPADRVAQAAQISTLILFDALTGNWDRWSGANVGIDRKTGTLLFVDNDASFFDPIPPAFNAEMAVLRGVDRFPRALVGRLRSFDALQLADAIGEEEPGVPLLAPRVIAAADQRRKEIVGIIDGKIGVMGDAAVLFF